MDVERLLRAILLYFQNFDGAKALQVAYYAVALVLASIGLWKAIRYAEGKMPKRLLEFASREEGRIVERNLDVLGKIRRFPEVSGPAEYFDVNSEIDRAISYLDRNNPARAASELHELAGRLEEKVRVVEAQLALTRQQAASAQLLFGTLAQKLPERKDQALSALRRAAALRPNDPETHKEIGIVEKSAGAYAAAIAAFGEYWRVADQLDPETRPDKKLLMIEACELTAECYRAEPSPDREKTELESALELAETITDARMNPHSVRARLLEALGENARNRRRPQTDKAEEYYDRCAAEYMHAGLTEEAERVRRKNKGMTEGSAA
jgi:tetratricopeptide (TPR) repeat protein